MLNIEKYKKEIITYGLYGFSITKENKFARCADCCCSKCVFKEDEDCSVSKRVEWLTSEYKEQILTGKEKSYLKNVIEFVRHDISYIRKSSFMATNIEYVTVQSKTSQYSELAGFVTTQDIPFENMILGKKYTLKELGL